MALANATDRKSASSPASRILIGFAIGAVLLLLTWAAQGLADKAGDGGAAGESAATQRADESDSAPPQPAEPKEDAGGWSAKRDRQPSFVDASMSPLEVGGALLAVLVLLVGAAFLLRRALRGTRLAPGRNKVLDMVDALPLGPRRFVYVVKLEGRTLVLGAGGDRVNLLAEYGEDELPAADEETFVEVRSRKPVAAAAVKTPLAGSTSKLQAGSEVPEESSASAAGRPAPRPSSHLDKALAAYRESSREQIDELPGAHRVPKAFRHLLERAMQERGEA